jgi:GH15 family glucan-1,4-alpha-glucosidase
VESFGLQGPVEHWRTLRGDIHADICRNAFNAERGSFVQAYGAHDLDASLLLLPAMGFLPVEDPRIRGTIEAIERELLVDGLVRRYRTECAQDGFAPGEGAFLACSFWLVDDYILLGRWDDARRLFERLLDLCNDVGLLSEEYDVRAKRLVGNFPQAYSHVSLVNSALNLTHAAKPAEQRSQSAAQPASENRSATAK